MAMGAGIPTLGRIAPLVAIAVDDFPKTGALIIGEGEGKGGGGEAGKVARASSASGWTLYAGEAAEVGGVTLGGGVLSWAFLALVLVLEVDPDPLVGASECGLVHAATLSIKVTLIRDKRQWRGGYKTGCIAKVSDQNRDRETNGV
jgi:hypothetical protein